MREKLSILIVDDNEKFSENIKDILELKGFNVYTVNSGIEAIELVKQKDYNLVLMDIKMPVMNGIQAFKEIKKIKPELPVIMITAFEVEELIKDALRNGAFGCLRKPIDFDRLIEIINHAVPNGSMILVVDDDKDLCKNISDILTHKGYKVKTSYDGESALRIIREINVDILLLDIKLPPLNGLETYLSIKDIRPNITVIVISGYMNELPELTANLRKNVYTCINKPLSMDKLLSIIKEIERQSKDDMAK